MSDELKKRIEDMMNYAQLDYAHWASIKEDEIVGLKQALADIQTPLDMLNQKRYTHVGEMLFSGARMSLTDNGKQRKTMPVMRLDVDKLHTFLSLLRKMGLLRRAMLSDSLIYNSNKEEEVASFFHDGQISDDDLKCLSGLLLHWTEESIEEIGLHMSTHLKTQLHKKDNQMLGQEVCDGIRDAWDNKEMTVVYNSVASALFSWSRDPEERSASQKGKGIQVLSESNAWGNHWGTAPSVFMTLETAKNASTAELLATLDMVPLIQGLGGSLGDILRRDYDDYDMSLYIRTCPASPRPGVLPNIKAATVKEFVDGIRYLASAMSNPDHPDYDPEGELCVMRYMDSDMSGVLVKRHKSMVVGLGTSGVTAGEGSTLIIPLSNSFSQFLEEAFGDIMRDSPDGFDEHEIEMVWPKSDIQGNYGHGIDTKGLINRAGCMESDRKPVITQIRGLGKPKPELKPPSTYVDQETGELVTMTIRGNVPFGTVTQLCYEDVGKGDLSDCAKLEADIKSGVIVEGQKDFVIYCPSGSTNCHAAGVANDHDLAIVYAPVDMEVTWTEVNGWVTTAAGVEPAPYNPAPFTSYFFDGCRDGDRYWNYGYHTLSQFFHTYINSPVNDPRFEAYLAGFYSAWIIKATLAVSLGETRHGYASQAQFTMKAGLLPLLLLNAADPNMMDFKSGPVGSRKKFYGVLKNREMGLDGIRTALVAVRECFNPSVSWSSSYGGEKYRESIDKAIAAVDSLIDLQNGGKLSKVLGTVNTLENAVHNCSYFFDKFVSSKTYFDIGTSNHMRFGTIPQQYMTIVPLHTHFYTHVVDEPHKVSDGAHKYLAEHNLVGRYGLFTSHGHFNKHVMQTIEKLTHMSHSSNGYDILAGAYGSRTLKHVESIMEYMTHVSNDNDMFLHKKGTCVLPNCMKEECLANRVKSEYGISEAHVYQLQQILGRDTIKMKKYSPHETEYAYHKSKLSKPNVHNPDNTVFTDSTREIIDNNKPIYEETVFNTGHPFHIEFPVLRIVKDWQVGGETYSVGDWVIDPDMLVSAVHDRIVRDIKFDLHLASCTEQENLKDIISFILSGKWNQTVKEEYFRDIYDTCIVIPQAENIHVPPFLQTYAVVCNTSENTGHTSPIRDVAQYMMTLWLSEYVVWRDGWDMKASTDTLWLTGFRTEYHASDYTNACTVFAGHTANQLLRVLMSIIDIDTLKQIMEENI